MNLSSGGGGGGGGAKSLLCDWGLKKRKLYVRQMLVAQKSMNNVELYLLCVLNLNI